MKTFLILASFPDSLVNFRGRLIAALIERGYRVHVAAPDLPADSPVRTTLLSMGAYVHEVALHRTGMNPFRDLHSLFALFFLFIRVRPFAFLAYTVKPVIYGNIAATLARVPHKFALITGLGYAFQEDAEGRGFVRVLVRKLYIFSLKRVDTVFFQNPDDLALFRKLRIIKSQTPAVVVNGSGVDIDQYATVNVPADARGEKTIFLLIARLLGDKGVREYAAAACLIKKKYPQVKFRLVGWIDGGPDSIKQSELDSWVNDGAIEYMGRLTDVRPAIATCSVYVLPSYREGMPRTVLEAMAVGRPIITTDAPGCRETVKNGSNGCLVPVKSITELAAAMERFILNPSLLDSMGAASRDIAEKKYDVNRVNLDMISEMESFW